LARPGDDEVLIEQMHGAALRVPADATAFSRREPSFNVSGLAIWDDATQDGEHIAWARRTAAAVQSHSNSVGGYLNYGAPDEPIERVRAAYATPTSSGYPISSVGMTRSTCFASTTTSLPP
jgi:hypothetical protein